MGLLPGLVAVIDRPLVLFQFGHRQKVCIEIEGKATPPPISRLNAQTALMIVLGLPILTSSPRPGALIGRAPAPALLPIEASLLG